ncbi:MAG TPA: DinB family protein [Thermoanaerobaculia bacterium]|jgi:hypothetical protein|nr:DinB family protein [Thermoanaerobaculia bacterium]
MRQTRTPSGRPAAGEYGPHAEADIALVAGDDAAEALAAQERLLPDLLRGLDDGRVDGLRYAPGKWTVKEVVGHMADDERIFVYRALCIARGDAKPLESFDEQRYVAGANFEGRGLADLLGEYDLVRRSSIALFESLAGDAWLRRGTVAGYSATVRGLAFHIAGHELHHLRILRERYLRSG